MSGHSPGPWRYKPVAVTSHPSEWEQVVLWDATGHSVALIKPGSVGPEDARLIAAAPELLAMLKRVVPALRDAEESLDEEIRSERGSMNDSPEPASRTVVEAEALIARLEGGR